MIASERLIDDRWMKLRADTCELDNGVRVAPYYVIDEPDWTHILARDEHARLLVTTQYRHGSGVTGNEFPGGVIDAGEAPLAAAQRELLEESGYEAEHWSELVCFYANPARQTNRVHVYLASGLHGPARQQLDRAEQIETAFHTDDEIIAQIASGRFAQGLHIASFYMALARRQGS